MSAVLDSVEPWCNPDDWRAEKVAIVLTDAEAEWRRVVAEPPGPNADRINRYIKGVYGLGWPNAQLERKRSRRKAPFDYERDGDFSWCGAFAAWCYGQAGLRGKVRHAHLSSAYRLWMWSRGNRRRVPVAAVQRGDIVIVGGEGGRPWGAHITLCRGVEGDRVLTFEGNAWGALGNGTTGEGVIRHERPFSAGNPKTYRVRHVVRPLREDFA